MIPEMIGEGYAAVRTLEGEAAIWAEDEIGKPSSIEKEQALLLIFDIFSECHLYLFREDTCLAPSYQPPPTRGRGLPSILSGRLRR